MCAQAFPEAETYILEAETYFPEALEDDLLRVSSTVSTTGGGLSIHLSTAQHGHAGVSFIASEDILVYSPVARATVAANCRLK